jgi:signal transduction histidine kinase
MQIQMARRKVNPEAGKSIPPEKLAKTLDTCCRQINRLNLLIEDMLNITRIQIGKFGLKPDRMDLGEVVKEVCDRLSDEFTQAECALEMDIATGIEGFWDPLRIEQVVVNLLSNTLKYASGHPIQISVCRTQDTAELSVKDFGPGIPEDKQGLIFERFERASSSSNTSGLGLGLFISREIITAHHGKIEVRSQTGTGAEFIVSLPLNPKYSSHTTN